jgi:hypothetical protein
MEKLYLPRAKARIFDLLENNRLSVFLIYQRQ